MKRFFSSSFGFYCAALVVSITACLIVADSSFAAGIKLPSIPELPIFTPPSDVDPTRPGSAGEELWGGAIWAITQAIKFLLGVIAIIFIVWNAVAMIAGGGNEEQVDKGKRGITYGVVGLVFALMVDTVIFDILYGGRGIGQATLVDSPDSVTKSIDAGTKLLLDGIQWFKGIVIIAAVAYLLFSGLKIITALGDTEKIEQNRKLTLWIGIGIVVILLNEIIIQEVLYPRVLGGDWAVQYNPNSTRGISEAIGIVRYFLGFLAVVAFAALIYGGALMIGSFGNEDLLGKAKKTLTGAVIGIVVVLTSYVIVSTFVSGTVS